MAEFSTFIISTTLAYPCLWVRRPPPFKTDTPPYFSVNFPQTDLPESVVLVLKPNRQETAMAKSGFPVPIVARQEGHVGPLRRLWDYLDADNIGRDRVLAGAPADVALDLFDVDNQFYRGKGLALRAVQVDVPWLEHRYEEILKEIRQAFRDRLEENEAI